MYFHLLFVSGRSMFEQGAFFVLYFVDFYQQDFVPKIVALHKREYRRLNLKARSEGNEVGSWWGCIFYLCEQNIEPSLTQPSIPESTENEMKVIGRNLNLTLTWGESRTLPATTIHSPIQPQPPPPPSRTLRMFERCMRQLDSKPASAEQVSCRNIVVELR